MKIDAYIAKHTISPLLDSLVTPPQVPPSAYSNELLLPSYVGASSDGTRFVTLYRDNDLFVVYEKNRRRVVGRISEDLESLN